MQTVLAVALGLIWSTAAHAQEIGPPPPAVESMSGAQLLPALIEHSRHLATIREGRLEGEGANFLRVLGRNSHFVMLGESHGNSGIANFATAYWRDLNALGYNYAAIEVDPYVAEAAERSLRAGGPAQWGAYLAAHGGDIGAPFLRWSPEVEFAHTVVKTSRARRGPALWGLDQIFDGAAPYRLRDISEGAHNPDARALSGRLAAAGIEANSHSWFASLDVAELENLRALLSHRRDVRWAAMTEALIVSRRIYAPFFGAGGEAYLSNLERETMMKRAFQARYEAAMRADGVTPRVMMKFGSYHMMRGATPTLVQGLGGFVSEYAVANGVNAVTISVECGPGGEIGTDGAPFQCGEYWAQEFPYLTPYIDPLQITIFDLRVWRLRPGRWEHLSADMRGFIGSYDVLVIVPNGPASPRLPELIPPEG